MENGENYSYEVAPSYIIHNLYTVYNYTPCDLSEEEQLAAIKLGWDLFVIKETDAREAKAKKGYIGYVNELNLSQKSFPHQLMDNSDLFTYGCQDMGKTDFVCIWQIGGTEGDGEFYKKYILYKPLNIIFSFQGYYESYSDAIWYPDTLKFIKGTKKITVDAFVF